MVEGGEGERIGVTKGVKKSWKRRHHIKKTESHSALMPFLTNSLHISCFAFYYVGCPIKRHSEIDVGKDGKLSCYG